MTWNYILQRYKTYEGFFRIYMDDLKIGEIFDII